MSAAARNRLLYGVLGLGALPVTLAFAWMLGDVLVAGAFPNPTFLLQAPADSGRSGGIAPILLSTLWIMLICLVSVVPPGIMAAVYLSELGGRGKFREAILRALDLLAAIPSVVYGLFGLAFFVLRLGMGYSILAGGLTLACMVLPYFIRSAAAGLEAVDDELRLNALSLGLSAPAAAYRVIVPAAMPALTAALLIALARAFAETAALLFTSGYALDFARSVFDSGRTVSVHIYDLALNVTGGDVNANRTAVVMLLVLFLVNVGMQAFLRFQTKWWTR